MPKTKNPDQITVIKAKTSDLHKPDLWPDESLPARGKITKKVVREQVAALYGNAPKKDQTKITEDLWNRFEFDTPYARYYNIERLGVPGKFTILREWTWPERFDVLERCHQSWERNPLSRAGIEWTNHFVIGNGGQISYRAKEVEDVLEEFREDPVNDIGAAERESCTVLQVDGEVMFRFYKNRQGKTVIIPIRPWHIHWIDTAKNNYKQAVSYHYVYTIYRSAPGFSDFGTEDVPADEMMHVAINKLPYELRGRPDIFSILPWLKAYRDWIEERARLNRRKSIYYTLTVKNASPDQVAKYQAQFATPPPPGSIFVFNENMALASVESNIHAEQAGEDGRQIKLMAISGMLLPEFYFADGANSTLASATAQSLPALRKFDDYQDILEKRVWIPIYKRVIQNAIDAGRIPEEVDEIDEEGNSTGKKIKALKAFTYAYPEIKEKDPFNLAKALQIGVQMQWVSKTTASTLSGYDPKKERDLIRLEGKMSSGLVTPTAPKKKGQPEDTKEPGMKPGMPIAPDSPQGMASERTLMPSASAPGYPHNAPASGGAGDE
jgi:hypothetical protein